MVLTKNLRHSRLSLFSDHVRMSFQTGPANTEHYKRNKTKLDNFTKGADVDKEKNNEKLYASKSFDKNSKCLLYIKKTLSI